jgi:hypothetical protein
MITKFPSYSFLAKTYQSHTQFYMLTKNDPSIHGAWCSRAQPVLLTKNDLSIYPNTTTASEGEF